MIKKLLIANRGEIACRIMKTAQKMGIATVAVYSDADQQALHVKLADEAIYIGAAPSKDSYLQGHKVLEAAQQTGADAIHPGYGFLSENAGFAKLCADHNIIFVGPPVGAIEAMGSKSAAKAIMEIAGVPLVPGYHGDDQSDALLKQHSDQMGYPVLLKAAAGGGGKGMRQVWSSDEFSAALAAAKREAISSFGDDKMLVEKYLTAPRHVEIQVFCDQQQQGVYLFERDCSVQRRHQKVIEEAPAPGMTAELRQQMGEAALKAANAIGYVGAGTVEFLLDADGSFYFMEMNTRLQVEHPVTEMISGQDLVAWQLKVASGEPLPKQQHELHINGHAFEARIYAEDPNNDFLPATGTLHYLRTPAENAHVRVDTGVLEGDEVSVYYDPMIAKLIVWDENREKALARLANALRQYRIKGVVTNTEFLHALATHPAFIAAELDTGFIDKHHQQLFSQHDPEQHIVLPLAALAVALSDKQHVCDNQPLNHSPWQQADDWRMNEQYQQTIVVSLAANPVELTLTTCGSNSWQLAYADQRVTISGTLTDGKLTALIDGHRISADVYQRGDDYTLFSAEGSVDFSHVRTDLGLHEDHAGHAGFAAPMNGTVVTLLVNTGDKVEKDQPLLIMEAMKMEHSIKAPSAGTVTEFFYQAGELVDGGADLLTFEAQV